MEGSKRQKKSFTGYEYKELVADKSKISFLIDSYENFGWELDEKRQMADTAPSRKMTVQMKRDKKIINKMELTRLQRNFEACIGEIEALEKAKTSAASIWSITLGIIGTAFMAGSTFAVTAQPAHVILCIILAVPGFIGWILPYFLYKKIKDIKIKKLTPLIEEKYDEIYEICEKGNRLLL